MSEMQEEQGRTEPGTIDTGGLSILGSLKERRLEVFNAQELRLPVPRWDNPEIVVKYKPVDHKLIRKTQDKVEGIKDKDKKFQAEIDGNADLLIRGCVAVVAIVDGKEYSLRPDDPHGEPTVFDMDLAQNLGLGDRVTAREVVKALFIAEGDIMSASQALVQFSGYRETEADSTVSGE